MTQTTNPRLTTDSEGREVVIADGGTYERGEPCRCEEPETTRFYVCRSGVAGLICVDCRHLVDFGVAQKESSTEERRR